MQITIVGVVAASMLVGCGLGPEDDVDEAIEAAAQASINTDPDFVHVYVNNVENLETPGAECAGDWEDLIWEMKADTAPDLFLVQQISDRAQLDRLLDTMSRRLGGTYGGIIAEAHPARMGSPCNKQKAHQTNAIVYREQRFEPVGEKHVWQVDAWRDGACRTSRQARTKTVMQQLRDKRADRLVTVASIHWGTAQGAGPDPACAKANVVELDRRLRTMSSDLVVWGGDTNENDRTDAGYRGWYEVANGDRDGRLNYRDVIYRHCVKTGDPVRPCLADNHTTANNRIDYLFARTGETLPATGRAHTVTFEEADASARRFAGRDHPASYSDHRAIRARIAY